MAKTKQKDSDEHYDRRKKEADEMFCKSCGAIIKKEAEICPKCGVRNKSSSGRVTSKKIKSRMIAVILAILLGGLGIHKFYIGRHGWGFIYLILFWTGIPLIVGIVEGIIYLTSTSTDEEFSAKYVR